MLVCYDFKLHFNDVDSTLVFDPTEFAEVKAERFEVLSSLDRKVLFDNVADVKELVDLDFNRVIYLGAGPFFGLAHEAQLKILKLTAGQVADYV